MELTLERLPLTVTHRQPTLDDVVRELRRSGARRAAPDALIDLPGMTGTRGGAAPILWVHGAAEPGDVSRELACAPDISEVYVEHRVTGVVAELADCGWVRGETMRQVVVGRDCAAIASPDGYQITPAGPKDMPELRAALTAGFDVPASIITASYPDEFFEVAAPVWMLAARDESGRVVGTAAARRQWRGAMLFGLQVDTAHRRAGLARSLASAAIGAAFADGVHFVHGLTTAASRPIETVIGAQEVGRWVHLVREEVISAAA